ncbi:MAG TPA: DUF6036 family nucleotidyltransferase [Pyrinomonadaceae bacterium]|nr:DUF6036 family nucleotidyltransferase [Pyrinomonadaceae bacterium]
MRTLTNQEKIEKFMQKLARRVRQAGRVYFTGGSTAVLHGWRDSTVDIDVRFVPDTDELYRALADLKEELQANIEIASPPDFIPAVPGWEDRSEFICREGKLDFYHFDLYSQALAKIERGHVQDRSDVRSMIGHGLIEPERLRSLFDEIKPELYRYPAISEEKFHESLEQTLAEQLGQ